MEKKIMVVDDEEVILRTMEAIFTRSGYKVIMTTKGTEALEIFGGEIVEVRIGPEKGK